MHVLNTDSTNFGRGFARKAVSKRAITYTTAALMGLGLASCGNNQARGTDRNEVGVKIEATEKSSNKFPVLAVIGMVGLGALAFKIRRVLDKMDEEVDRRCSDGEAYFNSWDPSEDSKMADG